MSVRWVRLTKSVTWAKYVEGLLTEELVLVGLAHNRDIVKGGRDETAGTRDQTQAWLISLY